MFQIGEYRKALGLIFYNNNTNNTNNDNDDDDDTDKTQLPNYTVTISIFCPTSFFSGALLWTLPLPCVWTFPTIVRRSCEPHSALHF